MNSSENNSNNLKTLSAVDLDKINGGNAGNVFSTVGEWIGTGIAYLCKGFCAIKG